MCNSSKLNYNTEVLQIPYFDEVLSTTISCDNCNYRFSDVFITKQNKPIEYKLKITAKSDLSSRVVRSSSATIEIPELGVKIEPAAASEAFVTNVEGILTRVADVVSQAKKYAEDEKTEKKAENLLEQIKALKKGMGEVTIIIKDPLGNSVIVNKKAKTRELEQEELDTLKTGMTIIDVDSNKK